MHKLDVIEILKEIEENYAVNSIKVNDIQVWPFLRSKYLAIIADRNLNINHSKKNNLYPIIKSIRNFSYGLLNLPKKMNYLVFSDTMELRLIRGKYVNKLAYDIIEMLGKDRTLVIENPYYQNHKKISKLKMKNVISLDFFNILSIIYPFKLKLEIENEKILKDINSKYEITFNYSASIKKFFYYNMIFNILFKIKKPKAIFISDYYNLPHQAAIYAARKLGIKTVELQHGIINSKHSAYNIFSEVDRSFFPEYLFVFGDYYKDFFNINDYFIDKKNIFSVGNMYIDYINNSYLPSDKDIELFNNFREKYKKIVAISSQIGIEDRLIDFLIKSSSLSSDILFIFVPRNFNKDYSNYNFPSNILILDNLDVYQIIKESDFHSSVNSTCAIEAPALGVPNILINISNESKKYYFDILTNPDVTKFVDTPEEFVKIIQTWSPKPKEKIKQLHEGFYAKNRKESLKINLHKINS